jgi:hypothetical protein
VLRSRALTTVNSFGVVNGSNTGHGRRAVPNVNQQSLRCRTAVENGDCKAHLLLFPS